MQQANGLTPNHFAVLGVIDRFKQAKPAEGVAMVDIAQVLGLAVQDVQIYIDQLAKNDLIVTEKSAAGQVAKEVTHAGWEALRQNGGAEY